MRRAVIYARLSALDRAGEGWRETTLRALEIAEDAPRMWRAFASERFKRREMLEAYALNRRIRGRSVELEWREPLATVAVVARMTKKESGPYPPGDPRWLPMLEALRTAA